MTAFHTSRTKRALAPVDVTTVQERVYQSLRLGLLRGEFLPGEQVSIRGLASVLGTSPMPVRDAVSRLIAERAMEQSGPRTIRVVPYLASDHENYIRIRMQLEGYAAERAASAERTAKQIDTLRRHNDSIGEALEVGDFETALAGNQAFHFELYKLAGYPQLLDVISTLWLRTGPIVASARQDAALFTRLFTIGVGIHGNAIDAVTRRDRAAARWAINLDIRAANRAIRRFYKEMSAGTEGRAEGATPALTR